jgi:hypothetical protein
MARGMFAQSLILNPEVVHLSRLRREMRRGAGIVCADHRQRLPARAQVMHTRRDRKRKIRIAVIGAHPSTVHPNARRWFWGGFKFGVIFNKVHQRLPRWRLEQRMCGSSVACETRFSNGNLAHLQPS